MDKVLDFKGQVCYSYHVGGEVCSSPTNNEACERARRKEMVNVNVQNIGNELLTAYASEDYRAVVQKWNEVRDEGHAIELHRYNNPSISSEPLNVAVVKAAKWMSENDPVWVAMSELRMLKDQVIRSCGFEEFVNEDTGVFWEHKETGKQLKPGGRHSLTHNGHEFGPFTV